ncbi:MAG: tRNA pseudouridine(55) synthase TruB [Gammaproteobacteria bacterium]|nr:tRNA pseudouridine(55) synthase TruB [Gammaproteobacteria bacterium]
MGSYEQGSQRGKHKGKGQRRYQRRDVNGILLLDKPSGLTSNKALQLVKHLFNARKAGHTGSLDPLATGLLPVCFGEATKISHFLLHADKSYRASCQLGVRTDSADADGKVIDTQSIKHISVEQIKHVLELYVGEIEQIPPMHSALKQNGVPLYKLAHQGIEVERAARTVRIHQLDFVNFDGNILEINIKCSKGTYIRTLAEDIGQRLGCGAHISALRRTQVGPFDSQSMLTLDYLNTSSQQGIAQLDTMLMPIEAGLHDWPAVYLSKDAAFFILQGQAVFVPHLKNQGYLRLYNDISQFLGIGITLDDGRIAPKRLMVNTKMG